MMALYLEPLDQMLTRELVVMECVNKVFLGWELEAPFEAETVENVRVSRGQVRQLLEAGVTELAVPAAGG